MIDSYFYLSDVWSESSLNIPYLVKECVIDNTISMVILSLVVLKKAIYKSSFMYRCKIFLLVGCIIM